MNILKENKIALQTHVLTKYDTKFRFGAQKETIFKCIYCNLKIMEIYSIGSNIIENKCVLIDGVWCSSLGKKNILSCKENRMNEALK